jgi:hypothetical protein
VDANSSYRQTDQNGETDCGSCLRGKETPPGLLSRDLMIKIKPTMRDLPQRRQRQLIISTAVRSQFVNIGLMLRRDVTDQLLLSRPETLAGLLLGGPRKTGIADIYYRQK